MSTSQGSQTKTQHRLPNVGETIAHRYLLLNLLGEGGFARVFEATDTRASGRVAVKVLHPEKSMDESLAKRFIQEVHLVRSLQHPNTIKITDTGTTETGCLFMAMEFLDGKELSDVMKKDGPMDPARVAHIAEQVLRALAEAHDKGIVHRDLKPPNIFITNMAGETDYVKVLDFGIAKSLEPETSQVQTRAGLVFCTPRYAAPEILMSRGVKPAADIFALGLIMIEMLTCKPAINAPSDAEIIAFALSPDPVALPENVEGTPLGEIIRRATAKNIEERYTTAQQMLADLRAAAMGVMDFPATPGGFAGMPMTTPGGGMVTGAPTAAISGQMVAEPEKGSAAMTIFIVLLVLILLGGGGFIALQVLKKPDGQASAAAPATETAETEQETGPTEPVVDEPEPPPVWVEPVATPLGELPEIPSDMEEDTPYLMARRELIDRSAKAYTEAAEMLQAALLGQQIPYEFEDQAKDDYLQVMENLLTGLSALQFCEAADRRLSQYLATAALIPNGARARFSAMRGLINDCRDQVEEVEWSRRRYRDVKEEGDELTEEALGLLDSDREAYEQKTYQAIAVREHAIAMLISGLENDEISPEAGRDVAQYTNEVVLGYLDLGMRTSAEVSLDEALSHIALLPEEQAEQVQEIQLLLQQEETTEQGWSYERYASLVQTGLRMWSLLEDPIAGLQEADRPPAPEPTEVVFQIDEFEGESPGLSQEAIQEVLAAREPEFFDCYNAQLEENPDLGAGRLVLTFTISGTGAVEGAEITATTIESEPLQECVVEKAQSLEFPAPEAESSLQISFPLAFGG